MPEMLFQTIHSFMTQRFALSDLTAKLRDSSRSHLIEITGKSGSGKSYLINPIIDAIKDNYNRIHYFSPHPMCFNQMSEIVRMLTGVDDEELTTLLVEHSRRFRTGRKYDLYYYLSEQLLHRELLHPQVLIMDDCDVLDPFTRDFIQYLVQHTEDSGIQIVVVTQERLFPFSEVYKIPILSTDDIQSLLSIVFPNGGLGYISESEILHKISGGNLMILEKILTEMLNQFKDRHFNLSDFLDKTYGADEIYWQELAELTNDQKKMLLAIFVLGEYVSADLLKTLVDTENYSATLKKLTELRLIGCRNNRCLVQKKKTFQNWLQQNPGIMDSGFVDNLDTILKQNSFYPQVRVNLQMLNNRHDKLLFDLVEQNLYMMSDNDSLLKIHAYILKKQKRNEQRLQILLKIGISHSELNQKDEAIEYFRQCLHLCSEIKLPAEQIIHHLASNLFVVNSSSFALEIIKKYSPDTIDPYWKSRILLLKADILAESELFNEASEALDDVLKSMNQIDDKNKRYLVQAEAKKIRGKIHYYINEWDQAEQAFKDAESLYNLAEDFNGLAAIYNNLGVLSMFQGDWDISEQFFLKSLTLEKENYNLNGISVCYNNLGGLMDDKGDQERSLYYLEEALKIQKLLSDPYNITNIYNNIGVTLMDHSQFERAEDTLLKSLETAVNFGFFRNTVASLNNLGALFFKKGDWNRSIEYYEQAIKRSEENNFTEGLLRSYNNLGEVYEKQNELNLAYDLYFKGLELLPTVSDEYIRAELYGNLGSVLTKRHNFKEAYPYLMESFDFFKQLNARDKIIEGCHKQAYYFILTRNFESADYYLGQADKIAGEINNQFEIGKTAYLRALLERKSPDAAKAHLNRAIQCFIESNNNYELSLANYELAAVLFELKDWEQALQILKNNKKIIRQYGSIKLLEKNDMLTQNISREYSLQLKESKFEEDLLNQFYEITQKLNAISDLDSLLDESLSSLVDISDADGGILCLHQNLSLPESWDYKVYFNFHHDDKSYPVLLELCAKCYESGQIQNHKQPHFAPKFNNILTLPLIIRKRTQGVVLLFCSSGTQYFSERMVNLLSALSNQVIVIIENLRSASLEQSHAIIREQLIADSLYSDIIGKSPEMLKIFALIEKIKDTPTSILLEGPSGTGKELIARALHYSSNRRNKAFVAQYCGALPESLLESELFGHVKGSFTGAAYDKKGLFEIADGGTFFLDEIADISLSTQAKLLRFLQEGEVKRVGSTKVERVNVRVICATNIPLIEKVRRGDFRLDLYYRLNVIRIQMPALKDRPGDIPLLAIHFLDKYNKRMNKHVTGITDEAMKCLERYEWPGNVRQLENEIERAVTLVDDNAFIQPTDFTEEVFRFAENVRTVKLLKKPVSMKDAIEELERGMIHDT
ncbi:MAG: sigma 54-interacting transcriptional regulator, partial [Candidatus Cloacimonetes bacterium]|nr:sigma 54-interacting transcriptional regulator [Candidatus Cloacimonadota bacterium]